jgi:hypothetical protein
LARETACRIFPHQHSDSIQQSPGFQALDNSETENDLTTWTMIRGEMIYEMLVKPHTFQNSAPNVNEEEISTMNATVGSGSTASLSAPEEAKLEAKTKQEERKCCDR